MDRLLKTIICIIIGVSFASFTLSATILFPYQGGTGTGYTPLKGDLLVGKTGGVYDQLPVGSNLFVLQADSTKTLGMGWVDLIATVTPSLNDIYVPYTGATADVDLGAFNFTTTGLGTLGSLLVDTTTLVANAAGYEDKIGFGTADPDNTWEFSDPTPTGAFAGVGMLLRNPTAVSASPTFLTSPALILSAQGKGATNQQYQWAQAMQPSGSADNLTFRYYYKYGDGAWAAHPFYLDIATGFIITNTGMGENIRTAPNIFQFVNSTAATSSVDRYTAPIVWVSQGWKTDATAGSKIMSLSHLNAPEKGVASPIGVHKWIYGINTNIPVETNEIMRMQWGLDAGVTGVFFNQRNLADYVVAINNDSTYLKFGTGQDAGITYDGTNMLLNPKIVGTGYLNIQGQTLLDDKLMFTQTDGNEYIDSLNDGYLDFGATTALRFLVNTELTGKITKYNNVATEGYGVPAIVDNVDLLTQSSAIGTTAFTNGNVAGSYRINYYFGTSVEDASSGNLNLLITWNDGIKARTITRNISLADTDELARDTEPIYLSSGSIEYAVQLIGDFNTARFDLHLQLERLN